MRGTRRKGFLDPDWVRGIAFWVTGLCILVSALACILAIWKFTETDVLWRTVATCAVVGAATTAFAWVNAAFGDPSA